MVKHGTRFERAWEFDFPMLTRLPAVTIQPTLEYDSKAHKLGARCSARWSKRQALARVLR